MNILDKLNVKQKLALPLFLSVFVMLFFFYQGYNLTVDMKDKLIMIHNDNSKINKQTRAIYMQLQQLKSIIVKNSLAKNKNTDYLQKAKTLHNKILRDIKILKDKDIFQEKEVQDNINKLTIRIDSYYKILLDIPEEIEESYADGVYAISSVSQVTKKVIGELGKLNKVIDKTLANNFIKVEQQLNSELRKSICSIVTAIIIFIVLSLLIANNIRRSLLKLTNGLNSFFDYLNKRSPYVSEIELKTSDEFGQMAEVLNDNISVSTKMHEEMYELNHNLEGKVNQRTKELEVAHGLLKSSVEYSSLIQSSFVPEDKIFFKYFDEFFTMWQPRNMVGGDIYLFDELKNDDECLLMVIDCTGHGVPGAFITMLVKAIERQILTELNISNKQANPSEILEYFNYHIKTMLRQDRNDTVSNAGFDGSILYYNRKENIVKFAGANAPLYVVQNDKLTVIKGDRQSVGYKKSNTDFKFTEHTIKITEDTNLYLTTDGFIDQNGGAKDFPFGNKRFKSIIETYHEESFADQKEIFLNELAEYMLEYTLSVGKTELEERNDDITLIGLKLKPQEIKEYKVLTLTALDRNISNEPIFYVNSTLTQDVVQAAVRTIEEKLEKDKGLNRVMNNLIYIAIELIQNVMHSSSYDLEGIHYDAQGICSVGFDNAKEKYYVATSNFMEIDVFDNFKERLESLMVLDKNELKAYRKELRKSGEHKHSNGAGLGLVEVVLKSTEEVQYSFKEVGQDKILFEILVYV